MYGFAGAGPTVKTRPCSPDVPRYLLLRRHDTIGCTALGRATAYRNSSGKASTLVGTFPRIEPAMRGGCCCSPRRRKRELWAILPFPKGMRAATSMAPLKRARAWMDVLSQLFPAHYGIHRVAATPHFSVDRLRARGRSCWTSSPSGVSLIPWSAKKALD